MATWLAKICRSSLCI